MASEILIRYNTKSNGGPLIWRVFVDGKEHLASSITLIGEFSDKKSLENGVEKFNIFCLGDAHWDNTEVTIKSSKIDNL